MATTENFKAALKTLNKAQKEAVTTIEGPVMVIAGPGTGKTQILTLRIANILMETDTSPSSILALTFTESGAKAMKERLRQYIGSTAYQVPIFTFHGFAQKLISEYPDAYTRVIGGRPINELEKISNIENIINAGEIKLLRPFGNPTYYVRHILRILGQLKQEYITPEHFLEIIKQQEVALLDIEKIHQKGAHKGKVRGEYSSKEKTIAKNQELLFIYRRYEALLSEQNFYDFEDMIVETVKALSSNEEMLRDLQENYQYILADEHQDVNGSQNKILELLSSFHESPNIFVVGDEKQAIYRFQGASLENFLYFRQQYPNTKVISLQENYRSGQTVLDTAYSLMDTGSEELRELRLPLKAALIPRAVVKLRHFSHQAVEDLWLGEEIKKKIEKGTKPSEVAVIVRTNREVEQITTLLRKRGLAVTASADGDILSHPITHAVQTLIKAVVTTSNHTALFTVLHGKYWGISSSDLFRVLSAQSYDYNLWQIISDAKFLKEIAVEDIAVFQNVVRVIEEARQLEVHEAPHRVLEFILQQSGFLNHLVKYDPFEGTRVVRRLYDEIESLVLRDGLNSLKSIETSFNLQMAYNLPLNAPYIVTNTESVQVMTAHKSKGLEFDVVFVPHLTDNNWSSSGKKKYFDIPLNKHQVIEETEAIEDERRLLYVAITRAKSELSFSSARLGIEGRDLVVSRLISEIDEKLLDLVSTKEADENFDPIANLSLVTPVTQVNNDLLLKILTDRGFSATSINNYLRSPWDYFYRNILRIPETQAPPMQFGTAVHNTLEYMTRFHNQNGNLPDVSAYKKKLEQELGRLPLGTEEYSRLLEKGLESLVVYTDHLKKTLPKQTKAEMKIRVLLKTGIPELPEILLTGKLDRLDMDDGGQVTKVIDYKTGKPKSRNVIEGATKDSDGGYKRQLIFYALLLSLYDDDRYMCNEGVLSFVEPDVKGHIKEETFVIEKEEIEQLKIDIIRSVKEIISGDFLKAGCDPKISDYCALAEQFKQK